MPTCTVCNFTSDNIRANRLVEAHFNLKVWCPICWRSFAKLDNLSRHLKSSHPESDLAKRRKELNLHNGFFLAVEPKLWLPTARPVHNSFTELIDSLFKAGQRERPSKVKLQCPNSVDEAVAKRQFVWATHAVKRPVETDSREPLLEKECPYPKKRKSELTKASKTLPENYQKVPDLTSTLNELVVALTPLQSELAVTPASDGEEGSVIDLPDLSVSLPDELLNLSRPAEKKLPVFTPSPVSTVTTEKELQDFTPSPVPTVSVSPPTKEPSINIPSPAPSCSQPDSPDLLDELRDGTGDLTTGTKLMYGRFLVDQAVTGNRITRINNAIMEIDRESSPNGINPLLPDGLWPLIRPARRNWEGLADGVVRIPLSPKGTNTVGWPPKGWKDRSPAQRTQELLRLGGLLDNFWHRELEQHSDVELAERYHAFQLPGSSGPLDSSFEGVGHAEERNLAQVRQLVRHNEVSSRRNGLYHLIPPEMWRPCTEPDRQLPRPVLESIRDIPTLTFDWKDGSDDWQRV